MNEQLTLAQVAQRLHCHPATVRRLIREERLPVRVVSRTCEDCNRRLSR